MPSASSAWAVKTAANIRYHHSSSLLTTNTNYYYYYYGQYMDQQYTRHEMPNVILANSTISPGLPLIGTHVELGDRISYMRQHRCIYCDVAYIYAGGLTTREQLYLFYGTAKD